MPRRVVARRLPPLSPPRQDTAERGARVLTAQDVGAVVQWMRGTQRVPQSDMAAALGVSPELLRGLEHGDRGVRLQTALDVFARLGLDVVLVPRDPRLTLQGASTAPPPPRGGARLARAHPVSLTTGDDARASTRSAEGREVDVPGGAARYTLFRGRRPAAPSADEKARHEPRPTGVAPPVAPSSPSTSPDASRRRR